MPAATRNTYTQPYACHIKVLSAILFEHFAEIIGARSFRLRLKSDTARLFDGPALFA